LDLRQATLPQKGAKSAARPAATKGLEPLISRMTRIKGLFNAKSPRCKVATRPAASKESEQEQTEETEGKEVCRKLRGFPDSSAKGEKTLCAFAALRRCVEYTGDKALERGLRRVAHPDVPRDVWTGCEEAEDGRGIEIRDGHFERPPVGQFLTPAFDGSKKCQ